MSCSGLMANASVSRSSPPAARALSLWPAARGRNSDADSPQAQWLASMSRTDSKHLMRS